MCVKLCIWNTCSLTFSSTTGFSSISIICSERNYPVLFIRLRCLTCLVFFILRTYALWDNNKVVLAAMLSTFAVGRRVRNVVAFMWNTVPGHNCGIHGFPLFCHCGCTVYEYYSLLVWQLGSWILFHSRYQFDPGHYRLLSVQWKHYALCAFSSFVRIGTECVTDSW